MIQTHNVTKTYSGAEGPVHALDGVDLSIQAGDFVVVHGSSGSGKTTLLQALGGMLRPTSGTVVIQGDDIYALSTVRRGQYRKRHVGFIFQKFFLLPYLTAFDNIRLSMVLRGHRGNHKQTIEDVATRLGMGNRLGHRPSQLSVGEQQRIAVARAIVGEPQLILADEPTGNLDRKNAEVFASFLSEENQRGRTIVLVTHDESLLDLGNRTVQLRSGQISGTA
ncbi:MAG: ABC transporter ATP-binding protein [Planctomycetes bacterium]|nr:ABC transporter ATP-binding protein [Planctomycetota bacterium]MBL7043868.1 ABC transporter ATP-binding protein [Pirellulaceae bacterium]